MLTTPKLIILGSLLCVSGYTVLINQQDSEGTYQLTKTTETSDLINTNSASQNHPEPDKFISLLNKMQEQLITQQDQLKEQKINIDTLFATLKDKEMFSSRQLDGDDSEKSDLATVDEQTDKQIKILDTALANEAIDEKWSNAAVDKVSEIFNQIMPQGTDITQLDCQSTFCKIGLDHVAEAELESVLDNFMFKLGWQTSSFIQTTDNEDGSKVTVVYLSRDGYSLPDV